MAGPRKPSLAGLRALAGSASGCVAGALAVVEHASWSVAALVATDVAARAFVAGMLIAGLGGGLVISPHLTLTLSQVPVERADSRAGRYRPVSGSGRRPGP